MKTKLKKHVGILNISLIAVLILTVCFTLAACNKGNTQTVFKIQYDDNGIKTLEVTYGEMYQLESIPSKPGHSFIGLFDAEVGGTRYVNESGRSDVAFNEKRNLVLFAQFKPNNYTVIFDVQGGSGLDVRSIDVSYGSKIPNFPTGITKEHMIFQGWYTAPDCGGVQIADTLGALPKKDIVKEDNFDLSDDTITLYAGFEYVKFTVTLYYDPAKGLSEEMQIPYGTDISTVVTEGRVDGKAGIAWSIVKDDVGKEHLFTGKIYVDKVLYAVEYAPVIDFDTQGGKAIGAIISRSGDSVKLPTPVRQNYTFAGWKTNLNNSQFYTSTTMPSNSLTLYAVWKPMLIFDTNGGTAVENIAEYTGNRISLPTTSRDGYIFAGWYTDDGEQFTQTSMPTASVKLTAKYWNVKKITKVIINSTTVTKWQDVSSHPDMDKGRHTLDLSEIYEANVRTINITAHYKSRVKGARVARPLYAEMTWFSAEVASDAYNVWTYKDKHTDENYESYVREATIRLSSQYLYICRYGDSSYITGYGYPDYYWTDFWLDIEYPDTSVLV